MRTPFATLAAAAAFVSPVHAHADEAENAAIIVTGQRAAEEAERQANATPGGTDVVGYKDYADKSLVSLRDALAFSPGVYLQPRFGQEVRISIRGSGLSRGFHMRGLTLLQDGVLINMADDNGDFQELEPIFFDHLEVYRGANALRFGSGTLGGAINGVTPNGRDARGLYLRADGGSFDTLRGLAAYGGASGPADFWAGLSADRSDGDRDHARRHSLRFNGNVGLRLSSVASTRFYASVNSLKQELPGALTEGDALATPRKGNFMGDQQRNIASLRLQNRTRFDWGSSRLDVGVFLNAKQLEYVQDIQSSGRHLLALINDILDLSKVEAGRMELELAPFDLRAALDASLLLVRERAARHGLSLELEVDDAVTMVVADERRFRQIMLNLLSNAVKFTPDGGRVRVSAVQRVST